jgi:hypothetical protein
MDHVWKIRRLENIALEDIATLLPFGDVADIFPLRSFIRLKFVVCCR